MAKIKALLSHVLEERLQKNIAAAVIGQEARLKRRESAGKPVYLVVTAEGQPLGDLPEQAALMVENVPEAERDGIRAQIEDVDKGPSGALGISVLLEHERFPEMFCFDMEELPIQRRGVIRKAKPGLGEALKAFVTILLCGGALWGIVRFLMAVWQKTE